MLTTTRTGERVRTVIAILTLLVLGCIPACYTLVQHPRVASRNFNRPSPQESCTSCHTRNEVWGYLHPERVTLDAPPWAVLEVPHWLHDRATNPDTTRGRE